MPGGCEGFLPSTIFWANYYHYSVPCDVRILGFQIGPHLVGKYIILGESVHGSSYLDVQLEVRTNGLCHQYPSILVKLLWLSPFKTMGMLSSWVHMPWFCASILLIMASLTLVACVRSRSNKLPTGSSARLHDPPWAPEALARGKNSWI